MSTAEARIGSDAEGRREDRDALAASARSVADALSHAVAVAGVAESDPAVRRLLLLPADLVSVTTAVLVSRQLPSRPSALLLDVQAEHAPAASGLVRAAGQLLLLAGELLWRGRPADAPLLALRALREESGQATLVAGALWALSLVARAPAASGGGG